MDATRTMDNQTQRSAAQVRKSRQAWLWPILFVVVIGGWWWPVLGLAVPACMAFAWGIAAFRGRAWCNWMCPRGAFHDFLLIHASRKKRIPALLRSNGFRIGVLAGLMGLMAVRLYMAWPNWTEMGFVFVTLITATTLLGIVLGAVYSPRAWCTICPAGTVAKWIGRGKKKPALQVDKESCVDCQKCTKACPMQIRPFEYKEEETMKDADCLKCGVCAEACPVNAISWQEGK